jgi:hypothetical protein
LVHAPWAALAEPPSRSYPLAPRASRARVGCTHCAARPMALPPYRGHTHCPCRDMLPWRARRLPTTLSLAIKAGHHPSRAGAQRHRAAIAAASGATVNPVLRPLSPPNHATPTFLLHPQSFHTRLLARPSHRFAGAELPAVAAAGFRHACPPVLSRREWVRKSSPSEPWTLPSRLPGQDRRRARRNPADRAASKSQGLHWKAPSNSRVFCANRGPRCEPQSFQGPFSKVILTPF